jgi:membrane protease YdiL (CAAX protease family)
MPDATPNEPLWLTRLVRAEPRAPWMMPYLAYLFLLMLTDLFPDSMRLAAIALHTLASLYICWMFRHHLPSFGRPFILTAVVGGVFAAWLWVAGHHYLSGIKLFGHSLGGQFPLFDHLGFLFPKGGEPVNPRTEYGDGAAFWTHVVLKITRACTAVPIVEELFWRGFILRAFINWDRFDSVPLGKFTWLSFIGSSLLSVVQHPNQWGVSILCWMLFNGLFYWRKSLLCLMMTHSITNLALYVYVVRSGDWQFW